MGQREASLRPRAGRRLRWRRQARKSWPRGWKTPEGVFDLAGNVWEWCRDWYYDEYATDEQTNPQGPLTGTDRVRRGGSSSNFAGALALRATARSLSTPLRGGGDHGFRVVVSRP